MVTHPSIHPSKSQGFEGTKLKPYLQIRLCIYVLISRGVAHQYIKYSFIYTCKKYITYICPNIYIYNTFVYTVYIYIYIHIYPWSFSYRFWLQFTVQNDRWIVEVFTGPAVWCRDEGISLETGCPLHPWKLTWPCFKESYLFQPIMLGIYVGFLGCTPWKMNGWNTIMEVWKMIFLFNWLIFRWTMLIFRGVFFASLFPPQDKRHKALKYQESGRCSKIAWIFDQCGTRVVSIVWFKIW